MSSFTTSSSADEFSPLQPIFPNLSTSEEMTVLIARIAELNRAKTMEPSIASSEVFGQDGNGMNDDEFSLDEEEDEQQEDRKTPTKNVSEDHLKAILERIGELEKQQQQQSKAFLQSQNDQKKILENIFSEMEKQTQKKVFLKFQENCWDANACHKDIEISGDKSLIVHHKGIPCGSSWLYVFAKYPIVLNKPSSDFFYYEISVIKNEKNYWLIFGFAVKQQTKLEGIRYQNGTYVFTSNGYIWINGEGNGTNAKYSYGVGDTVGIGVNSATRQQLEKNLEEMQKKLMEHQQNEQQKIIEQMEKMLQNENDKRKNDRQGMEEKMDKLEKKLDTKAFQEELEKKVMERIDVTVQTKVDKMEMAHQQQKVVTEKAIFERIGELEGQQKHQKQQGERETKASEERFSQLQNFSPFAIAFLQSQNDILEKISEIEKQTKKKVLLKFQENCWDSFACHEDIEISGDKSLIVRHKGYTSEDPWSSVFAKYPILLNKSLSDFFYFEISVMKKEEYRLIFGFAVKQQRKLEGHEKGTYAYESNGWIWINGERNGTNAEHSYSDGDTVGIGVNLASRQIIFTKNGLRLDTSGFLVGPSFADGSFYPFVSLRYYHDQIEANFGPNFKFDLATL